LTLSLYVLVPLIASDAIIKAYAIDNASSYRCM
jgi:hypothetical protein